MTKQEQIAALNSQLQASQMGGMGLARRIQAIKQAIADLEAVNTESQQPST